MTSPARHQRTDDAPDAPPAANTAAIIAIIAGGLSLFIIPILLGPAAVIAGTVGEQHARRPGYRGRVMASVGVVLGLVGCLFAAAQIGV